MRLEGGMRPGDDPRPRALVQVVLPIPRPRTPQSAPEAELERPA